MGNTRKLRWGILSTANIGMQKVTPAIMKSAHSEVVAIGSRNLDQAQRAANKLGIPKAFGSYEELISSPDIDAIYNPLPNHLHVEMTLAANAAGKHVLCEKPVAITAEDAKRLRTARPDRLILEAFMVRFHKQWLRAREIMRSGELGEVRAVRSVFTYYNADPNNVRNKADIGGGGLLDIGCYPITGGRFFFESEPLQVVSLVDRDANFGTDRQASVIADFGNGRQLTFLVSTQLAPNQSLELLGTKGRVELIIPFNAPADTPTAVLVDEGKALDGSMARREIMSACDQYTEMAEAFALAALGEGTLPYGVEDAIRSMHILDAIFESEKTGAWAPVKKD
ncbi:Gfo/Idh/MocA family oxidoreductase [Devosia sp. MC521]|uniref:Gfo/Idh/MocA family protein n=1 Tax=Devosia sp. MC521 TaxID=2759954 RepID=UPI0015FBA918|nr:Gfo/Idh/MocA family oxidoreductase [Devosia sp. MC521]MBJ6985876.1 Gfo/Idh/MocA family oxidoreductase [Devosia sp. MC521]QMW61253.1 Gfo/Idh/MocA family oxidoreductase [Devosia sp. MC521]